ncbi:hypothetical protein Taro_015741 [Colocasia esculenta]|uniref:Uncharacterized protein n=1 Tax=Colocasia esculenta TaxID=4460 RepID=A0A843UIA3_COLES|nr:hypothetical protein [Colocasia esculenta]
MLGWFAACSRRIQANVDVGDSVVWDEASVEKALLLLYITLCSNDKSTTLLSLHCERPSADQPEGRTREDGILRPLHRCEETFISGNRCSGFRAGKVEC